MYTASGSFLHLLTHNPVFVSHLKVRTLTKVTCNKPRHLIFIQIYLTGITFVIFIIGIIRTILTITFLAHFFLSSPLVSQSFFLLYYTITAAIARGILHRKPVPSFQENIFLIYYLCISFLNPPSFRKFHI